MGYKNVYAGQRDRKNGRALLEWGIRTLQGLKASKVPDYLDKICAVFFVRLAGFQLDSGDRSDAEDSLRQAIDRAHRFDAAPDYSMQNLQFVRKGDGSFYDQLGITAVQAVENALREIGSDALWAICRASNGSREEG